MVQPSLRLNKLIQYCFYACLTEYLVLVQKNRQDSYSHHGNASPVILAQLSVRLESCIGHASDSSGSDNDGDDGDPSGRTSAPLHHLTERIV